jgi:hypothetical protein
MLSDVTAGPRGDYIIGICFRQSPGGPTARIGAIGRIKVSLESFASDL